MILRLLLAIFFVGLIVFLFKRVLKAVNTPRSKKKIEQFDDTVACHKCGTRIPEREAVHKDGHHYCCPEHAEE